MRFPIRRALAFLAVAVSCCLTPGCSSSGARAVTDAEFEEKVLKSEVPVLVDFWATWCGPCRIMAPVLDQVASGRAGKLRVLKMDVDKNPATPGKYGIQAIPTLLLFSNGKAVGRFMGVVARDDLEKGIDVSLERAKRPDLIVHADSGSFAKEVLESKTPVLVDFWAVWCGPCRILAPLIEDFSWEYEGRLKVVKVDFDTNKDLAMKYRIQAIPNVLLFKGGRPVRQWAGVRPREEYVEAIDKIVPERPTATPTTVP